MLTIHHLGVSQSDRVVWLMEELGLPYELVWYKRGADGLMPPEYVALHPAATAPVDVAIEGADEGVGFLECLEGKDHVLDRDRGAVVMARGRAQAKGDGFEVRGMT